MKIYQSVVDSWKVDSEISGDIETLSQEAIRVPRLHSKYLNFYARAAGLAEDVKADLDAMLDLKTKYISGHMSKEKMDELGWEYDPFKGGKKPTTNEGKKKWIEGDNDIRALKARLEEAQTFKDIVRYILDEIKWRGKLIDTILATRKYAMGER